MKKEEILVCKENFYKSSKNTTFRKEFISDKKYFCIKSELDDFYYSVYNYNDIIEDYNNAVCVWYIMGIDELNAFLPHFYTEQQYRKLKLKKLNEKMSI